MYSLSTSLLFLSSKYFNITNNFSKYRPRFIVIEIAFASLEEILSSPIAIFLFMQGYRLIDKMGNSVIFREY